VLVYRRQDPPDRTIENKVNDILFRDGATLRESLRQEMQSTALGDQLFNWIYPRFPETLKEDLNTTAKIEEEAVDAVDDVRVAYMPGQLLVSAGVILQQNDIDLLLAEYQASLQTQPPTALFFRFVAVSSVFFITLAVMISLIFRIERRRPQTAHTFFYLMLGMILTVAVAQYFPFTNAESEILPLMLFVMLVSIIYSWELAALLSIFLTIVIVCGNGGSMNLFIILLCTSAVTAVQLGRLRTRGKLVIVGTVAGVTALFLTITMGIQADRTFNILLCTDAVVNFFWAFLAGLLMTGVLPFIEKQFGILTDMRLLEFGDVSHPLLQTLIKVAPATYGHCMQVGAIAETAADTIHARGLLTRVGAYFHDIGKIMKPEYYSENQGGLENVHDTIEPQISTIVLVAHVKDGVDLARQYHLPRPLINLIEQHHGTSLVSFFYGRATKGGTEDVEESTFRYPGPKPQTKEAAILMIADTCESACRSMGVGIPPNKIEGKVRALVKQKLDDGQFDDSGLTLRELKIVEKSVIGSIVAAMHGRIQYPEGVGKHEHHQRDVDGAHVETQTLVSPTIVQKVARMG
jgi:putative nucleotidyltransferase with HDIG domain